MASFADKVLAWYARNARDLPWRRSDAGAWAVLISEVMLQQTPVQRVLPVYQSWLSRWPVPAALAAESRGEAVRMWGRLGYPRRALRLHECSVEIVGSHGGNVPDRVDALLELPGVGAYTARAVAAFAFGQRHPVVDTNVRRFLTRAVAGHGEPPPPSVARDLALMEPLLPTQPARAARFAAAAMEVGALVCTARSPSCRACPVRDGCVWRRAGAPPYRGPARRPQQFAGTDRQVRGLLLDVLRGARGPVTANELAGTWHEHAQRVRALDGLVADGLVEPLPDSRYALPGEG